MQNPISRKNNITPDPMNAVGTESHPIMRSNELNRAGSANMGLRPHHNSVRTWSRTTPNEASPRRMSIQRNDSRGATADFSGASDTFVSRSSRIDFGGQAACLAARFIFLEFELTPY